jgi:excisionase family DNA binding protein
MINMADQFLNVEEACEFLRIKKSWLYQNHKLFEMPSHNIGRKLLVNRSELAASVLEQ